MRNTAEIIFIMFVDKHYESCQYFLRSAATAEFDRDWDEHWDER
jgi:hypothetical protein